MSILINPKKRSTYYFLFIVFFGFAIIYEAYTIIQTKYSLQKNGIWVWHKNATNDGYNLVIGFDPQASCKIFGMDGIVLKELSGGLCTFLKNGDIASSFYIKSRASENFAILGTKGIRWIVPIILSHDIAESPLDGSIWVLAYEYIHYKNRPLRDDVIYGFTKNGRQIFRWNASDHTDELSRAYKKNIHFTPPDNTTNGAFIFTLLNSLQIIPINETYKKLPAFRPGNILLSDAENTHILILDPKANKIVWTYRPKGNEAQHYARYLNNGNILYFFNNMIGNIPDFSPEQFSFVQELDPITKKIAWEYKGNPLNSLVSRHYGSAQRLPNGNTLISYASGQGEAIEVNPRGEIVWRWLNPIKNPNTGKAYEVYRVERIPKNLVNPWLDSTAIN